MNKGYRWDRILKRTKGEKSLDTAPLRVGKSRETLPLKLQSDKALLIITLVASLSRNMGRTGVLHSLLTEYNSTSLYRNMGRTGVLHTLLIEYNSTSLYRNMGRTGVLHMLLTEYNSTSLYRNMGRTEVLHTLLTEYNSTSPAVESTATRTGGITSLKSFNVPGLFFYPAGVYILHRKSVVFFSPMIWNSADMN